MSQIYLSENAIADHPADDGRTQEIIVDLAYRHLVLVNVVFVGQPKAGDGNWILVDAGLVGSASEIMSCAKARFGGAGRPAAILMTHGHFDHVGALEYLAGEWDVPVYAHRLEMPYLNGRRSYPPPDAAAGGGLISAISPLFPRSPVNVANRLYELPDDQSVPYMPGWKWIHTPGHCPGHVTSMACVVTLSRCDKMRLIS
jgi:glyoxylase-like metal-dependent hydrolase (beta-lactamase superfamily II)